MSTPYNNMLTIISGALVKPFPWRCRARRQAEKLRGGVVAEFQRALIKERQREGIAKAGYTVQEG